MSSISGNSSSQEPVSAAPSLTSYAPASSSRVRVSRASGRSVKKDRRVFTHPSGAPKRPPSSFGIYKHRLRKKVKGRVNFRKFNAAAGRKWKSLSEEAKAPFIERAQSLMAEYNKAKQSYMRRKLRNLRKRLGPSIVSPSPRGHRTRRVDKRKLAGRTNPYIVFSRIERPKVRRDMPDATFAEIAREIARRWRTASPAVKQRYARRAASEAKSMASSSSSSSSLSVSPISNVRSPPTRRGSSAGSSQPSVLSRMSRESSASV